MNFRRWVVFSFLIHVLVVMVDKGGGLVLYLLTAHHPAQHGKSGITASLPFILGAVANLGLATALVYFVRRGRYSAQVCFETTMGMALGWGTLIATLAGVFVLYGLPLLNPEWVSDPMAVIPVCAAVPLLLVASYANSTQLATERVQDYGVVHLVTALAFLPAFFAVFFWYGATLTDDHVPLSVAWGRLFSTALVALLTLWMVRRVVTLRVRVHREFLGEALRYGWKANLTSTLAYLNHRLDLIVLWFVVLWHQADVVGLWLGVTWNHTDRALATKVAENLAGVQVAYYSMAVTWAELVWHFPEAMRDLFFSKVAGSSHEQARLLTPVLSRLGLLLSLLGALAIVFAIDPIMLLITAIARPGDDVWSSWSPHVNDALWLLVPGTVAFTVSKVLQADLAARDRLQTCVNAQAFGLVSMLGFDVLWIPEHGAIGAAMASTASYVLSTVYTVIAYSRQTQIAWWRCLVVHGSDFRYVGEIFAAVVQKLRRRSA